MRTHQNPLAAFEDDHRDSRVDETMKRIVHREHKHYPLLNCAACMSDSCLFREDFSNITTGKWGRICEQVLKRTGIQVVGDSGQASTKGITVAWEYDKYNLRLTLKLVHRTWYDPSVDSIDASIKGWVNAA